MGNEISMLPLSVPLDIEDPAQRLKVVTMRSAAMKSARIADVVALIGTWIGWAPPALQQSLAALPFLPQPIFMFNMVCTNVPGPMVPLYSNGRQLLTYYPHVPCGSEVGISVAISSYNQNLYYGITYDHQAAPDGELFRDFLIESYEELRGAAGVAAMPASRSGRQEPVRVSPTDLRAHRAQETPPIPEAVVAKEEKPAEVDSADLPSGPLPQPAAESETVPISAESPASESETQPVAEVEISAPVAEEIIIAADEPVRAEQDQLQLAAQMDAAEPEVASEFRQAVAEPMALVTETTVEAEGLQPEVPAPEVTTAFPLVGEVVARLEAEPPQKVSSVETTTPAIHEPELHAAARTNGQTANKPRPKERKTRHRKTAKAGANAA